MVFMPYNQGFSLILNLGILTWSWFTMSVTRSSPKTATSPSHSLIIAVLAQCLQKGATSISSRFVLFTPTLRHALQMCEPHVLQLSTASRSPQTSHIIFVSLDALSKVPTSDRVPGPH